MLLHIPISSILQATLLCLAKRVNFNNHIEMKAATNQYGVDALTAQVGSIIILALYMNRWSVDKYTESFEQLAKLAFELQPSLKRILLSCK